MPVFGAILSIVIGTPLGAFSLAAVGALLGGFLDLLVRLFSKRSIAFDTNDTRPMVNGEYADKDTQPRSG